MTKKKRRMNIFVDADSCPVKKEIISLANEYDLNVFFVASYKHQPSEEIGGIWKYVDSHFQAVDLFIVNHLQKGDLLITQDIGLASLATSKGGYAFSPRGNQYSESEMAYILDIRHLQAKARRSGRFEKGARPFTDADRKQFLKKVRRFLSKYEG